MGGCEDGGVEGIGGEDAIERGGGEGRIVEADEGLEGGEGGDVGWDEIPAFVTVGLGGLA
jgi:hypothetical protein